MKHEKQEPSDPFQKSLWRTAASTADGVPDLFAPDDCFAWCQPDAVNYVQKNLRILCILFFQSLAIFLICYAGYRLLHYDYRDQSVIVLISSHECKCPFLNCLELSLYVACQKESKIVPVCCESPEGLHIRIILRSVFTTARYPTGESA